MREVPNLGRMKDHRTLAVVMPPEYSIIADFLGKKSDRIMKDVLVIFLAELQRQFQIIFKLI